MLLVVCLILCAAQVTQGLCFRSGTLGRQLVRANRKVTLKIERVPRCEIPSFPLLSTTSESDVPAQSPVEEVEKSIETNRSLGLVRLYYRSSWISWWVQVVLTVVASVILTFANTVRQVASKDGSIWMNGFAFSVVSAIFSGASVFWTWNTARSCLRLSRVDSRKTSSILRKYCQTAVGLSLAGIFANIIGAEQIAGTLASKVLSSQTLGGLLATNQIANSFQPLDIFLVQANTNVLVSHFASLLCYILLQTQL
eukprot:gene30856-37287_t